MMVVADNGATTSRWWYGEKQDEKGNYFELKGFNPRNTSVEIIQSTLSKASQKLPDTPGALYFYSTGIADNSVSHHLEQRLKEMFPKLKPEVQTDLTAAGRALLGEGRGVVAILGTGSNAGFYENHQIIHQPVSLGFLLGDEGSGAHIGKKLLKDYLEDRMPDELAAVFAQKYSSDKKKLVSEISDAPSGSTLAAFASFAYSHRDKHYINDLLKNAFEAFFEHMVKSVQGKSGEIAASGSIAWNFRDQFTDVALAKGYSVRKIVKDPMDGLVTYHQKI